MNRQIFKLEQLLQENEQSIPFFFNYREENRPTPFGESGGDSVDWTKKPLQITIGPPIARGVDAVSVVPEDLVDDGSLLSVLDNSDPENPDNHFDNQTADQAYQIIQDRFLKHRAEWWPEVYGTEK